MTHQHRSSIGTVGTLLSRMSAGAGTDRLLNVLAIHAMLHGLMIRSGNDAILESEVVNNRYC